MGHKISCPAGPFTEFFTKLREDANQAHQDRRQFFQDTRAAINQQAERTRHELAEFASELKAGGQAFRRNPWH